MPFIELNSPATFQQAVTRSGEKPVVLYKHSRTCPVSAMAQREMEKLSEEGDLPVFRLVVQASRSLSAEIASALDVEHESPQLIVLANGKPVFSASHHRVTAEAARQAASDVRG